MSDYTLDTIDPLWVQTFDGFDLPDDISVVRTLSDGTSEFNAVLQSSGTGMPQASLTGMAFESSEVDALQAIRLAEAPVTFVEPLGSHTVVMQTLRIFQHGPGPWPWSMTLVELPDEGS